jgi:hypothetical protein
MLKERYSIASVADLEPRDGPKNHDHYPRDPREKELWTPSSGQESAIPQAAIMKRPISGILGISIRYGLYSYLDQTADGHQGSQKPEPPHQQVRITQGLADYNQGEQSRSENFPQHLPPGNRISRVRVKNCKVNGENGLFQLNRAFKATTPSRTLPRALTCIKIGYTNGCQQLNERVGGLCRARFPTCQHDVSESV